MLATIDPPWYRSPAATAHDESREAQQAFTTLVTEHHARLAHLAYVLCSDRQQAEDAVAEAYARVWPRFKAGALREPLPYLRAAVVNQVWGGMRRRLLERREQQRRRVDWRDGLSAERSTDDGALLTAALHRLPEAQRAVIILRFYEDLSELEVATLLGISVGTVKSRSARGLARLRVVLHDSSIADA